MTNRTVFETAIVTEVVNHQARLDTAQIVRNGAIATATSVFRAGGSFATYQAAVKAADAAFAASLDSSVQQLVGNQVKAHQTWKSADGAVF